MTEPTARRSSDPRTRTRAAGGVVRGVFVSLAIHGGVAAAILGTAWGVARARREEAPPVVLVADFFDPAPARPGDATAIGAPSARDDGDGAAFTTEKYLNRPPALGLAEAGGDGVWGEGGLVAAGPLGCGSLAAPPSPSPLAVQGGSPLVPAPAAAPAVVVAAAAGATGDTGRSRPLRAHQPTPRRTHVSKSPRHTWVKATSATPGRGTT